MPKNTTSKIKNDSINTTLNTGEKTLPIGDEILKEPKEQKRFSHLSYWPLGFVGVSILQAFEACPISFYLRYYKGVEFPTNKKMAFGTIFQEALTAKYEGKEYKEILSWLDEKEEALALKLIEKSNSFKDPIYFDEYMFVDMGIGIPVRFAVDLITKHEIVETKTTGGYYNKSMAKKQMQGSLYYGCVKKLLGLDLPVKYQIFNKEKVTCELVPLKKTDKDTEKALEWARSVLFKIKTCYDTGEWIIPIHSRFPCNLKHLCPIKIKF